MTRLPQGLVAYKRTPIFTETTVPVGLLKDHSTKKGTWGLIHVEEGGLWYFITDPERPASHDILSPDWEMAVVEPTIVHRVEPMGRVRFWVEFWRAKAADSTQELPTP